MKAGRVEESETPITLANKYEYINWQLEQAHKTIRSSAATFLPVLEGSERNDFMNFVKREVFDTHLPTAHKLIASGVAQLKKAGNKKPESVQLQSKKIEGKSSDIGHAMDEMNDAENSLNKALQEIRKLNSSLKESPVETFKKAEQEIVKSLGGIKKVVNEWYKETLKDLKWNESAKENRMNVMEAGIDSKNLDQLKKTINDFGNESFSFVVVLNKANRSLGSISFGSNQELAKLSYSAIESIKAAESSLMDAVKKAKKALEAASRISGKESKPAKKLNVAEAPMTPKQKSIADKKAAIAKAYAKQGVVTMRAIDKNEYPPIPGMEGPFQYRNGQILYYDPKEGKYYDRKTDMYQSRAPESVQRKVAESKRRKAIRRKLVAEALKEIFSVKKGV